MLFGLSLAVVVTLAGPLALFNPWFVGFLQQRHAVAETFGATQEEIDRVTGEMLRDIALDGPFTAAFRDGPVLLDEAERSHMSDVAGLVRVLLVVAFAALVVAALTGWRLRRETARRGRIMVVVAGVIGAVAVGLALFFAVAFDAAFTLFHELFFPPGTWQFTLGSNLITLFPEPFWFDASLTAGATIVVAAAVVAIAGFAVWRRGSRSDARSALL